MPQPKQPINPFYVLAALFGIAFTLTGFGYYVMILRSRPSAAVSQPHPLMNLLDQHGMAILGIEVALVAVFTLAAIVLDHYRGRRANTKDKGLGTRDHDP